MKTISEYFELALKKAGNTTRLAEALEMTQPAMSQYSSAKRIPDATTAAKIAIYLNIKEFEVIAAAELARAKTPEARRLWDSLGKRWAVIAAVMLNLGGWAFPSRVEAGIPNTNTEGEFFVSDVLHKINYTQLRKAARYLSAIFSTWLRHNPQPA